MLGRLPLLAFSPRTRPFLPLRPLHPSPSSRPLTRNIYQRFPRSNPSYNRFFQIRHRWQTSSLFRTGVYAAGLSTGSFIVYNLEQVPVSGRWRFNWVSEGWEREQGIAAYEALMREYRGKILPDGSREARMARKVLGRLVEGGKLEGEREWEVRVVRDGEMNAFVLPGGKVFVNTGILPICQNEDGLATVLGHELAHNVAHHSAERLSLSLLLVPVAWLVSFFLQLPGDLSWFAMDFVLNKPGSRRQETEADYMGLMMMAQSCYDPNAAIGLWQRMEQAEKVKIPQLLSTHPSNHNRIGMMEKWLPEALDKREQSECRSTLQFADGFRNAIGNERWDLRGSRLRGEEQDPYAAGAGQESDDFLDSVLR